MPGSKQQRDPYVTARTVPFTNKELVTMFDVTLMTLHLWRRGTPTKSPLKTVKGNNPREVRYPCQRTLDWAKKNGVAVKVHPDDLANGGPAPIQTKPGQLQQQPQVSNAPKKSGPKPRGAAVASLLASEHPTA